MSVKPNLVVGAIGAAVFLLTGSLLVANWRALTDTRDYTTDVTVACDARQPPCVPLEQRSSDVGSGATATETFLVAYSNVTRVHIRLTWDESTLPGSQHQVTATLRDPKGATVQEAASIGGKAGLTLEKTLLSLPEATQFSSVAANVNGVFASKYPIHDEGRGAWTLTIQANTPTGPAPSGVTYRVTFALDYYMVALHEVPRLESIK